MSLDDLDPVLTQPKRLAALGILSNSERAEFAFLRDHLKLSDSDLSKQMSALTSAGYAEVRKTGKGRTRQTWYSATRTGIDAINLHVAALQALVAASAPDAATSASD